MVASAPTRSTILGGSCDRREGRQSGHPLRGRGEDLSRPVEVACHRTGQREVDHRMGPAARCVGRQPDVAVGHEVDGGRGPATG